MSQTAPDLRALIAKFYRDEGDGLGGARLYRCRVCEKGWQIGGTFPGGPQHHLPCPVAELDAALSAAEGQQVGNGNIYVFCDTVDAKQGGCIRGAGHNGEQGRC
jgi:hypothetical protein